jgi:plastocyanin
LIKARALLSAEIAGDSIENAGKGESAMSSRVLAGAALAVLLGAGTGQALAADIHGQAVPGKRVITMAAVEPKGGTTVDKEPFPLAALPEGGGYILKKPDASGRWEVSTYRFLPSQIIVNQGDEVTLEMIGVNGAEHPGLIEGYDVAFNVKRGQLTTVTFKADKAGVFRIRCDVHHPSMHGELIVLPRS